MELRNVKTFIKIAEIGNFSRAASDLGYAQSTVTMQIQTLERELGVSLFERNGKSAVLSAAGKEFLDYAYDLQRCEAMALEHFAEGEASSAFLVINTGCGQESPRASTICLSAISFSSFARIGKVIGYAFFLAFAMFREATTSMTARPMRTATLPAMDGPPALSALAAAPARPKLCAKAAPTM